MRVLVHAFALGILLTILNTSMASADVILIRDGRLVDAGAHVDSELPPGDDVRTPFEPFAPFTGLASQSAADGGSVAETDAQQRSSVNPSVFTAWGRVESSAVGNGTGDGFSAQAAGSSLFDIEFDAPVPHAFSLTGLIDVDVVRGPGTEGFGEVDLLLTSLQQSGEVALLSKGFRNVSGGAVDFGGILPAGRSRLQVEASTESVSSNGFTRHIPLYDLTFTLTPTPEPGSLFLFGGGLLLLARRRNGLRRGAAVDHAVTINAKPTGVTSTEAN